VRLDPFLFHEDLGAGAYEPEGGYADPALTTNSIALAAKRLGVEICPRTVVTGLRVEGGRIQSVIASGEEISTRAAVNTAGPWGAQVAAFARVHIPITCGRHAVVLMHRPAKWTARTPVWVDLMNGFYFKPEGAEGILTGSIRENEAQHQVEPDFDSSTVDYETTREYAEQITKRFPVMAEGTAQGGWVSVYDVTPDWLPVIDHIPDVQGFYCAVGFSGHGFKIAPAVGTIMAELILDGTCRSYDISTFRFLRFQENSVVRSKYDYGILG
jgi:glycine/D-amino acid oxidase-like deaminating enzyme